MKTLDVLKEIRDRLEALKEHLDKDDNEQSFGEYILVGELLDQTNSTIDLLEEDVDD